MNMMSQTQHLLVVDQPLLFLGLASRSGGRLRISLHGSGDVAFHSRRLLWCEMWDSKRDTMRDAIAYVQVARSSQRVLPVHTSYGTYRPERLSATTFQHTDLRINHLYQESFSWLWDTFQKSWKRLLWLYYTLYRIELQTDNQYLWHQQEESIRSRPPFDLSRKFS